MGIYYIHIMRTGVINMPVIIRTELIFYLHKATWILPLKNEYLILWVLRSSPPALSYFRERLPNHYRRRWSVSLLCSEWPASPIAHRGEKEVVPQRIKDRKAWTQNLLNNCTLTSEESQG